MANLIVKLPSFLVLLFKHFLHLKKMHVIFKNQFSDQVSYMHAGLKKINPCSIYWLPQI